MDPPVRTTPRVDQQAAEVERYRAFIDEQDPTFQPVTQFLVHHLGVEHAGVSLVGREVVELLSAIDLSIHSLDRASTFCALLMASGDDTFHVRDATSDPRVAHLPVVTGPPHVRAYASVALRSPRGIGLGALFVMSSRPRTFTDEEVETLRAMARQVETLLELRYREAVTGLPNRAAFVAELDRHLAERGRPLTVAYVELPDHRLVNTAYGRDVGDEVLREVGRRLGEHAEAGLVAHLGDDRFAVVWDDDGALGDARRAALRDRLREPVLVGGARHDLRLRVGLASFPRDAVQAGALLDRAATAATTSRPGWAAQRYEATIDARSRSDAHTLDHLRAALAHDGIVVHYQPQVSLTHGRVEGFEALARLRHPDGTGLVPPGRFLPVADDHGLSTAVDLQVLRTAGLQSRAWAAAAGPGSPPAKVAVNMSRAALLDEGIVGLAGEVLADVGADPGDIEVEITEEVFDSGDPARLAAVLGGFRDLGITVAIDDFGTGTANLDALRCLPVDRVKVDRLFVHGIASSDVLGGLYRLVAGLSDLLDVELVAEGTERLEDVLWLLDHGCPTVQGWFCAPAVPADAAGDVARRVGDLLAAGGEACVDARALALVGSLGTGGDAPP